MYNYPTQCLQVDIAIPEVFVGGLLGSMLIFLFSAWACSAVGRTAQEVVNEVRRQFIERPGIMVSTLLMQSSVLLYASINNDVSLYMIPPRTTKRSLIMDVVLQLWLLHP
jgi:Na+/H+-translocating membrane pyrophosphatase